MSTKKWRDENIDKVRAYKLKHYYANKKQYLRRNKDAIAKRKIYLQKVKAVPCMDCEQRYSSYVMDFDHRDPSQKKMEVSKLVNYSWKQLKEEITKCDIVCSNCHRERTHKRRESSGRTSVSKTD